MSDSVQMPKRSLELPLGCKDLHDIDLVRNWEFPREGGGPWRETTDRLAYIEGQMVELFRAAGRPKLVYVSRHQDKGCVMIISDSQLDGAFIAVSCRNAPERRAIRDIFAEAGFPQATQTTGHWKTKDALKYILPANDTDGVRLIGEVFRAGYWLRKRGRSKIVVS